MSAVTPLTLLLHAGPGSSWQAMVVLAGVALTVVGLAAAIGRLRLSSPGDLVLPLAGTAIAASLAPLASESLSDGIGWGLPLAVVWLAALLLAAFTRLDVRLPAPLPMGTIALAAVAAVVLHPTLTVALHPPPDVLPLSDDSELTIVAPADGATVPAGDVEVVVEVTGGSIGPGNVPLGQLPDDPEEAGTLAVAIRDVRDDGSTGQQQRVEVAYRESCTVEDPCTRVSFTVPAAAGGHELVVDFNRGDDGYGGDGTPLAPYVRDQVGFTAEATP